MCCIAVVWLLTIWSMIFVDEEKSMSHRTRRWSIICWSRHHHCMKTNVNRRRFEMKWNDSRFYFSLFFSMSIILFTDQVRANNSCHCVHTLLWLHLMCLDGLELNLFTQSTCFFFNQSSISSCHAIRGKKEKEKNWTTVSISDANGTFNSFFFSLLRICCYRIIIDSSILSVSRNDLRLIKHESTRVQCVNLIHSRTLVHRHIASTIN